MRTSVFRSMFVGVLVLSACGPSEAPPPKVAKTPPPRPAAPKIEEDRSPVDAPAGLVLSAHAAGLRAIVRSVRGYLPADAPALDPRALVSAIGDGALDRVVDVDKPADIAVVIPEGKGKKLPLPNAAIAFGVEDDLDVASALREGYRVDLAKGGVMTLTPTGGGDARCVIAPAIGPAKRRLVCALEGDPMALAPWLARGVTREPEGSSPLHVDADVARVRAIYGSELDKGRAIARGEVASEIKTGFEEIDRVLKTWAKGLVDEAFDLLGDLDHLTLDVALPANGVQPTLAMTFGGTKSWIARAMLAGGDTPGAPSQPFAKLPADNAWLAGWSRATPQTDALLAPIQSAVKDLIVAAASEFKWPAKDRDLALDVVKQLFPAAADTAFVSGNLGAVELPESAPRPYGMLGKSLARTLLSKTYSLSVVERESKAPIALAKAFGAWITRPSFTQTYRALTRERMSIKVAVKPAAAAKDLPKGSHAQRYELDLSMIEKPEEGAKKKPAKPKETSVAKLSFESLIVPDGATRTWIGLAQNLDAGDLWKRVQLGMSGTATKTISAWPGFDVVTASNATTGGLFGVEQTIRSLGKKKAQDIINKLPDQGQSAFAWRVTPSKPPKSVAEITAHIPRDAISAIYFAAMRF